MILPCARLLTRLIEDALRSWLLCFYPGYVSQKDAKHIQEILDKVDESYVEYHVQRMNRIWLSHQACMRETLRLKGSIHYDVPHIKKKLLEREGRLPIRLKCEPSYILAAEEFLSS